MATDSVTVSPTYNGDSVPLTAGMIVRLKPGANNNVVRAQADTAPHVQGVNGVVISGASAPTSSVLCACVGRKIIQMEAGLTPAVGDTVYVSPNVAGSATNVLPANVSALGTIADISNYVRLGTVEADVSISAVTPASVSGVSSVNTQKPGDSVVPSVGAVIIKGGGIAHVANLTALAALSATNFPINNTLVWVSSLGAFFQLQMSAFPVDHVTVQTVSGLAGTQWLRLIQLANPAMQAQATWFVDGQNTSGTASDENDGASDVTPLLTISEIARRVWGARIAGPGLTINVMSDCLVSDSDVDFQSVSFVDGGEANVIGTPLLIHTGTVSSFTAASTGPAVDDNRFTDSTLPVSFAASGLTAQGLIFKGTTGATAAYFFLGKDLGTKTARITTPSDQFGGGSLALQVGSSYQVFHLPIVRGLRWNVGAAQLPFYQLITETTGTGGASIQGYFFSACAITGSASWSSNFFVNTVLYGLQTFSGGSLPTTFDGGGIVGTGATSVTQNGAIVVLQFALLQGVNWAVKNNSNLLMEGGRNTACDCTAGVFVANYWSQILFLSGSVGYGLGGMGNTSFLVQVGDWSNCAYTAAGAPVVAGSTTLASPLTVGTTNYAVSALPILKGPGDQGIFQTDTVGAWAQQPTTAASGAVTVALTNAPTGSAAAPVRWARIPDGVGGFYTFPSVT